MKIGLVRHFKVKLQPPDKVFITREELSKWFQDYDTADIEEDWADLGGVSWDRCYASDLPRAVKTAAAIYQGDIIPLPGLRELPLLPLFKGNFKLPFWVWAILTRAMQVISKKRTKTFQKELSLSLDSILSQSESNVLIVSHGFVMMFLKKELKKRGFNGAGFQHPAHGKLYLFEK